MTKLSLAVASAMAALALAAPLRAGTLYQVGPTRPTYQQLTQLVGLLGPGDVVEVDGAATYNPVWFTDDGAPNDPIVIRGLRVGGQRPILQGGTNTIQIEADHIVFESFEITGGSFRCVYHHGHDVIMRDLYVHDCPAHGILGGDYDTGSLTLEYSEIARCGNGTSQHPVYMSTNQDDYPGAVFRMQYNYLHDQTGGNVVKSRAERNEIYYNWIEGGAIQLLELIGPDNGAVDPPPNVAEHSDVVGNVFIHKAYDPPGPTGPFAGNGYFVRVGSDMRCDEGGLNSTHGRYRFVNNTFLRTTGAAGSDVFRPFGYLEAILMSNNVFASSPASGLAMLRSDGGERCWTDGGTDATRVFGQNNWYQSGTVRVPSGWTGSLSGASPGFVNATLANLDLRLAAGSPLIDQGTANPNAPPQFTVPSTLFPPAFLPPPRAQLTGAATPRIGDGPIDIGAYERPGLFEDGFETAMLRWSLSVPAIP